MMKNVIDEKKRKKGCSDCHHIEEGRRDCLTSVEEEAARVKKATADRLMERGSCWCTSTDSSSSFFFQFSPANFRTCDRA